MAGVDDGGVGSGRITSRSDCRISAIEPPGKSTRPIEPAKSTSPQNSTGSSAPSSPKTTDPRVCPGACLTAMSRPARAIGAPSASSRTSSGSAKVSEPNIGVPRGMPTPDHGSVSCATVGRVDVGGDVTGLAHGQHREGVVEVAVREQHRDRVQPVLGDHLVQPRADPDTRVDHHALLARRGGHHPAVGVGHLGREARDEHGGSTPQYR